MRSHKEKLTALALAMVNQEAARIIIEPQSPTSGFWFGGGNLVENHDGSLYLVGRYRNYGDSRTGLDAGERGLELAIFCSQDRGQSFKKILTLSKQDLCSDDRQVLSIEGSALHWHHHGIELFISSEKIGIEYPLGLEQFLKPGAGVWTIERLQATSISRLQSAAIEPLIESDQPGFLHVKDPVVYPRPDGDLVLLFCTHPYCWSSSNTAYAIRRKGSHSFDDPQFDFFPRGVTWDVAITRATAIVDVPQIGSFESIRESLVFYDGGESLHNLDKHTTSVKRSRGYSCEEIGGVGYFLDDNLNQIYRLSRNHPLLISPHGTGCSRYVDVHRSSDGYFVTWQQSQPDQSQPLVLNFVSHDEVANILA